MSRFWLEMRNLAIVGVLISFFFCSLLVLTHVIGHHQPLKEYYWAARNLNVIQDNILPRLAALSQFKGEYVLFTGASSVREAVATEYLSLEELPSKPRVAVIAGGGDSFAYHTFLLNSIQHLPNPPQELYHGINTITFAQRPWQQAVSMMDFTAIWEQSPRPGAMLLKFHQEVRSLRNIIDYAILETGMQLGIPFSFFSTSVDNSFSTYPTLYPEDFMDQGALRERYHVMQESGLFDAHNYPLEDVIAQYEVDVHLRPLMRMKERHPNLSINLILMPEAEELRDLQTETAFLQLNKILVLSSTYIDRYFDWRDKLRSHHFYDQVHLNSSGKRAFSELVDTHIMSLE